MSVLLVDLQFSSLDIFISESKGQVHKDPSVSSKPAAKDTHSTIATYQKGMSQERNYS